MTQNQLARGMWGAAVWTFRGDYDNGVTAAANKLIASLECDIPGAVRASGGSNFPGDSGFGGLRVLEVSVVNVGAVAADVACGHGVAGDPRNQASSGGGLWTQDHTGPNAFNDNSAVSNIEPMIWNGARRWDAYGIGGVDPWDLPSTWIRRGVVAVGGTVRWRFYDEPVFIEPSDSASWASANGGKQAFLIANVGAASCEVVVNVCVVSP